MISELNQRASILARSLTPDGGGGYDGGWTVILTQWAKLQAQSASESFAADALSADVRHGIVTRRNVSIAAGQRVAIGARSFRIVAVLDDGPQQSFVTLQCEAIT